MKAFFSSLFLLSCASLLAQEAATGRRISAVEAVRVSTPVGTAPRLPYQLWVKYADGHKAYRQVRWSNSALVTEQEQAAQPVGASYQVEGYIVGDDSTPQGLPITANVQVVASGYATPAAMPVAQPLPLSDVQLTGDNRLTHNRDIDINHLLTLDVRQQLYNYRDTYGFPTDGYPVSDGWDSPTTKLKGHGSGHYMSALALAYASCTDAGKRKCLKERIRTMVDELRRCQERTFVYDHALGRYREARDLAPEAELRDMKGTWADFDRYKQDYAHYGYGYLNAIPAQHCVLVEMYRPYNNEQWVWAPYYTIHKQLAGLIDIANYVDDKAIAKKALLIAKDMGLWVWNRLHYRTYVQSDGTQAERRSRPGNRYEMWNMYIAGEVGGMAESLARLSMMVDNNKERACLREAATFFDSPAFFEPLAHYIDAIRTRHANQHIPMITGALASFRAGGSNDYYHIAQNFWTMVQGRYRYAMGGVGNGEMFRQPYTQMLAMTTSQDPTMNETCCAYNLAKLTKDLNGYAPNDARYMDYYERLLYNQIVGSLHAEHYAVLYQYAVGRDASKPWGNETPQSTCCGGTGAENHVKYQEATYFVGGDTLWVGLYLPTIAKWEAQGVVIQQDCTWPAERSVITFPKAKRSFAIKLRVPYWATEGFEIRVNGKGVVNGAQPSTYVTLAQRKWAATDTIEVVMPYTRHIDYGADVVDDAWMGAYMQGPLVMAQDADGQWLPDYAADQHITHYFPFKRKSNGRLEASASVELAEAMELARSRQREQETWMAMTVKVPEYAPWAPHGYARMIEVLEMKEMEASSRLSTLNAILTTMRPGNLAEPEDLEPLQAALAQAQQQPATKARKEAIAYAKMVISYVTDGSGTPDMIRRAIGQLKESK
ncbi:MAG: glycoside hydrolase family 127 protein [Prevotella sp.]|nr:glycoside hydrolase family 127 protein [Prevotella sp.]